MTSNIRQKVAYKKNIQRYFSELNQLCHRIPDENSFLSLETTETIRELAKSMEGKPCLKFTINFEEKMGKRFANFINSLYQSNSGPIYFWTHLSNLCGIVEIDSIFEFNFNFSFDVNNDGIIALLTKDLSDKMTLDFFKDSSGNEMLEVELRGDKWPLITY